MNFDFICVDYQFDFVNKAGKNFNKGKSVDFIENVLFPYLKSNGIKVSEIISDYRLPRGKSRNESCVPGTVGFNSCLPEDLRKGKQWIKCMHNPLWIRDNIGIANSNLGKEYQNPQLFNFWITESISNQNVVLFGETADCCLLQVASELYFRGFDVYYIYEATDPMNERLGIKDQILSNSSISIYAKVLKFDEFRKLNGGN